MALRNTPRTGVGEGRRMRPHDMAELCDRDHELVSVHQLLDDAVTGAGGLILIDGEAGIGKTRLIRAACQAAREKGMTVLTARGGDLEKDLAFGITRELLMSPVLTAAGPGHSRLFAGAAALAQPVLAPTPESAGPKEADVFGVLHGLY